MTTGSELQVERIVVANHTTAKVIMKEPIDLRSMADGSNVIGGGGGAGDMMSSRSEVRYDMIMRHIRNNASEGTCGSTAVHGGRQKGWHARAPANIAKMRRCFRRVVE